MFYVISSYKTTIITIVCEKAIRLLAFLYNRANSKKYLAMLALIPIGFNKFINPPFAWATTILRLTACFCFEMRYINCLGVRLTDEVIRHSKKGLKNTAEYDNTKSDEHVPIQDCWLTGASPIAGFVHGLGPPRASNRE